MEQQPHNVLKDALKSAAEALGDEPGEFYKLIDLAGLEAE